MRLNEVLAHACECYMALENPYTACSNAHYLPDKPEASGREEVFFKPSADPLTGKGSLT